jgi:hypothetical protein
MAGKQENNFWRELRHKGGCCCFGWAMYAPWAFYMGIWALYNPKLPIWPLIGLTVTDLAGDRTPQVPFYFRGILQNVLLVGMVL